MDLSTKEGRKEQGSLIQQASQEAGISLEHLAREIGCSRALIYQYVSGTTLAQPDKVQLIGDASGKALGFFYGSADQIDTVAIDVEEVTRQRKEFEDHQREFDLDRQELERERSRFFQGRVESTLRDLQVLAEAQGNPPNNKALSSTCERLASAAHQAGRHDVEAQALLDLGNTRLNLTEFDSAQNSLQEAIRLFSVAGDSLNELKARQSLGRCLMAMGHPGEAMQEFQKVAAGEGWANRWQGLVSLGAVHELMGDYGQAMKDLDASLEIVGVAEDDLEREVGELYVRANFVNVYLGCGDYTEALRLAQDCYQSAQRLENRDQYLEALFNYGVCHRYLGQWAKAHEQLHEAMELSRYAGEKEQEAFIRGFMSGLLAEMGEFERAKEIGKDALSASLSLGLWRGELFAHQGLAEAYWRSGMANEALYHTEAALRVTERLRYAKGRTWLAALRIYLKVSEEPWAEAVTEAQGIVDAAEEMGAEDVRAWALIVLSRSHIALDDCEAAAQSATAAIEAAERTCVPELIWRSHWLLSRALHGAGQMEEALRQARQCVVSMNQLRAIVVEADFDDTLLEDRERFEAVLLTALLLEQEEGTQVAEQFLKETEWPPLIDRWKERGQE